MTKWTKAEALKCLEERRDPFEEQRTAQTPTDIIRQLREAVRKEGMQAK